MRSALFSELFKSDVQSSRFGPVRDGLLFRASVLIWLSLAMPSTVESGPPFITDDPEPVEYRNWELYVASQFRHAHDQDSSTLPHFEANYGLVPDLQIHLLAPLQYAKQEGQSSQYGYGDTEIGAKYRFIHETKYMPQVGVYPLLELPTGDESRGLGNGKTQVFLPLWVQKSWGPLTSYGGGGYWFNPGEGNRDYWQLGWVLQRELNKRLILGAELYYKTAARTDLDDSEGFNVGAIINFTDNHHLLFSVGQDIYGPNYFSCYIGYIFTFGPEKVSSELSP